MKYLKLADDVERIQEFVHAVGCTPEVRANITSPFRRKRRWAIQLLGERLETVLAEALPSEVEVLRAALRKLSAELRAR